MDPEVVKETIGVALRRRAGYCDFWAIFQWGRSAGAKTDRALWKVEAQNCWDLADAVDVTDGAALCRALGIATVHLDNANDDEEGQEA
jgi:hypothetical protein